MRKTRVLLFLFVLIGTGLFAQSNTKPAMLVGNEPLLQKNALLKEEASKVNAAYDQWKASTTSSKTAGQNASTKLDNACNSYIAELGKQALATPDKATRKAITREISRVKKIQPH